MKEKKRIKRETSYYRKKRAVLFGEGTALLLAFSYDSTISGKITVFAFFTIVNIAAVTDWHKRKIPDVCCIFIVLTAAAGTVTMPEITCPGRIAGSLVISLPMLLFAVAVPGSFGGGDIKFLAACGLFLGTWMTLASFVFAIGMVGIYVIWLLIKGSGRKTKVPLGPFLGAGMVLGVLFGDCFCRWFLRV